MNWKNLFVSKSIINEHKVYSKIIILVLSVAHMLFFLGDFALPFKFT